MGKFRASEIVGLPDGVHHDGGGLFIRVRKGRRNWFVRCTIGGKRRQISLGSDRFMSLTGARAAAESIKLRVARGEDPTRQEAAEPEESPTFGAIWRDAVDNQRRVKAWTNEKAVAQWGSTIETYLMPSLGRKRVDEITRDDVLAVLLPLWQTKNATAAKVRGRLETVLDYAKARGWRDGENPASWKGNLELFLPARSLAAPVKHFEAASLEGLRDYIIPMLMRKKTPATCATLFGCLTALRTGEFVRAEWVEVDEENNCLIVPWTRLKTAKRSRENFRVPLSRQARLILDAMRGLDEVAIFSGRVGRFLAIDTPRNTLQSLTETKITMHGMRSVFRDWCAATGQDFTLSEKCLNHAVGDSTVRAYLRSDFLEERRKIMQAWADTIMPMEE